MNEHYYISIRLFFQHVTSFQNICGIVYNDNSPIRFRFDGEPNDLSNIPQDFLDYKIIQIYAFSTYIYFKVEQPLYPTSMPVIILKDLLPLISDNIKIYYNNPLISNNPFLCINELTLNRYAHSITITLANPLC